jgi:hypothetical protein
MFESQWKPKPRPKLHPSCAHDPSYWDGYNDALDGKAFEVYFLGQEDYEANEYRAGYIAGATKERGQ